MTDPKSQDEENGEMAQFVYGQGVPAPVNPNDNDAEHLTEIMDFVNSETYRALGRPNYQAFMQHTQMHMQQQYQKQQMQMMQAQQAAGGNGAPTPGGSGQATAALNVAQLSGLGSAGGMGDVNASGPPPNGFNPPNFGGQ